MKPDTVIFDSTDISGKNEVADNEVAGWDVNGNSKVGQASEFPFNSSPSFAEASFATVPLHRHSPLYRYSHSFLRNSLRLLVVVLMMLGINMLLTSRSSNQVEADIPLNVQAPIVIPTPKPSPTPTPIEHFAPTTLTVPTLQDAPDPNFSVVIPSIGAKGKVVADVSPFNPDEYMAALKIGIAHTKGTALPGTGGGNIFMFAHSTNRIENVEKYNAIFYLLREVSRGDDVFVYYQGIRHHYTVKETKIVPPEDTTYLVDKSGSGEEQLVLQTCWPPGTVDKRFLVIAQKYKSN